MPEPVILPTIEMEDISEAAQAKEDGEEAAEEAPADDLIDDLPPADFRPTHLIGTFPVMQLHYHTGLPYYLDEKGAKRRPTRERPLRAMSPKPDPARTMLLDREAFCLCAAALGEFEDRSENGRNVAERIDEAHVRLSLFDPKSGSYDKYIIRMPDTIEVVGSRDKR